MEQTRKVDIIGRTYELSFFVDESDYQTLRLWEYKWTRLIGRTTTYIKTNKKGKTIFLHRLIMGLVKAPRSVFVDHIDGNGLNNYRTNLRVTDNRGNQGNRCKSLSAETSSSYKGVTWHIRDRKWQAAITSKGKAKQIGYYQTETEAATAYNKAAIELFGPMARLNVL